MRTASWQARLCLAVAFPSRRYGMMLVPITEAMGEKMSLSQYLFGFSGRINRAKVWVYLLIVIVVELVAMVIAAFGFDWMPTLESMQAQSGQMFIDYSKLAAPLCKGTISLVVLIVLGLIALAYIWSALAIYTKRLHDRNKSMWWLLAYVLLPEALFAYSFTQLTGPMAGAGPNLALGNLTMPGVIAYSAALLIGLWVFIELFCLKGTTGANRFGRDPLTPGEPNWCDPVNPAEGCTPKPED